MLVSVCIPIVKSVFLEKSIISCLKQTYNNFELIILNNANDNKIKSEIRDIVNKFSDNRILYFENDAQLPMIKNWNKCVELSSGDLISLLCDDDSWEPRFLEVMVKLAEKYPNTNIFHSRLAVINENDNVLRLSPTCPEHEDGIDFMIHRLLKIRVIYLSDFVVRTKSLKEIEGFIDFPDGWGSDIFTWFKIALNGGIAYSSEVLFNYRDSIINVSNSTRYKNKHLAVEQQYFMLKDIAANLDHSRTKYEIAKKEMLYNEIIKFLDKEKKYIVYMMLKNKYKLPLPFAMGIASIYQYFVRLRESKTV